PRSFALPHCPIRSARLWTLDFGSPRRSFRTKGGLWIVPLASFSLDFKFFDAGAAGQPVDVDLIEGVAGIIGAVNRVGPGLFQDVGRLVDEVPVGSARVKNAAVHQGDGFIPLADQVPEIIKGNIRENGRNPAGRGVWWNGVVRHERKRKIHGGEISDLIRVKR